MPVSQPTLKTLPGVYFIRINELDTYRENIKEFCDSTFSHYLLYRHSGKNNNNYHWHILGHCTLNSKQLRYKFHSNGFDKGSGNGHLSIKGSDGNIKNYAYGFHESHKDTWEFYSKGYTDAKLKEFQDVNTNIQKEIKDKSPSKMIDEIYAFYTAKKRTPDDKEIFMSIFKWYKDNTNGYYPNKHQAHRYIIKLQAMFHSNTDEQFSKWTEELYREWF